MDKRKLYVIFTIIIVALLPSAVFASVIIDQSYSVSTSTPANLNPVEMTQGPNYKTANALGFATLTNGTTTGVDATSNTISFGYVDNDTSVELLCVLEVKENPKDTSLSNDKVSVSLTVPETSTSITFYYSTIAGSLGTEISDTATSISLTSSTSSVPIIYISVIITPPSNVSSSPTATLDMSYTVS